MNSYSIEQQGMLKILEHIYSIIRNGVFCKIEEICNNTGIERKYFTKLIRGGIIQNLSNAAKYPHYKWVAIPPNIYMAIQTLKDLPEFGMDLFDTIETDKAPIERDIAIIPFSKFWDLYDKKIGNNTRVEKKWYSLTNKERLAAMDFIPKYIQAQPNKQFRKNPETFLNNKSWNDEIVSYIRNSAYNQPVKYYSITDSLTNATDEQLLNEIKDRGWTGNIKINKTFSF